MSQARMIGVIAGGDSAEREVSLASGRQVNAGLQSAGERTCLLEIFSLDDLVPQLRQVDVAFNCLHGGRGENGTVQLLFEVMGLPYVGSGPLASALAMDKLRSKAVFLSKGLAVPKWQTCGDDGLDAFARRAVEDLGLPLVLKPCDQGSSLGVRIVHDAGRVLPAATSTRREFGSVFAEEFVPGRELTVSILLQDGEERVLPIVELLPSGEFYDYDAKYTEGLTQHVVPAPLDEESAERVRAAGLCAHRALGCNGFSRVDLRLGADGIPYVLEVNTLPGITRTSNLPASAEAAGIPFPRLLELMLLTADKEGSA